MAARLMGAIVAAVVAMAAVGGARVSAEIHHVVVGDGGRGPALDVTSWLSGRVFKVGDKILFKNSGTEDVSVVELQGPEEFESCDLTNPIRMYTDRESHVALEKEGVRYFASGNVESCKNGLKLPVPVQPSSEYWPPPPNPFGPPEPTHPPPHPYWQPPPPSGAAYLNSASIVIFAGLLIGCTIVFM